MRILKLFVRTGILGPGALAAFALVSTAAWAGTVNAVWNTATDVPVTASSYTATGNTVNCTLNFAPATGTELMVVKNTGLGFIGGTFGNLAPGQKVALSHGGINYGFAANYYGGSGNDLVLVWATNRAFAWGDNSYCQLGDNTATIRAMPVPTTPTDVLAGKTLVALAAGCAHSLALCSDGTMAAWGTNDDGQLGDTTTTSRSVPVAVNTASGFSALHGKTVAAIAAGAWHSLALCSDGTVAAWGDNSYNQLGDLTSTYRLAPGAVNTASGISALFGKTAVAIAAGEYHSLALCSDGTVAAWGCNEEGELGDNTGIQRSAPVAVNTAAGVSALHGKTVVAIAAGEYHSLALCSTARWPPGATTLMANWATIPPPGARRRWRSTRLRAPRCMARRWRLSRRGRTTAWRSVRTERWPPGAATSGPARRQHDFEAACAGDGEHDFGRLRAPRQDGAERRGRIWSQPGGLLGRHHGRLGLQRSGQLGDNSTTTRLVPVAVNTTPLAAGQCFARAATGPSANHTLVVVAVPVVPRLQVQQGAGTLTFRWGTNFSGFIPQANPVPANPAGWADLSNVPVPSGANYSLTLPTTNAARFFRLRSP